ncbi:putative preribosome binding protein [Trypoxylus dichotomus]
MRINKKFVPPQGCTETFCDIGGVHKILDHLCRFFIHIKNPNFYQDLGVPAPRGFILHGPSGCGKTLLCKAICGQFEIALISAEAAGQHAVTFDDIEQEISMVFETAFKGGRCIFLIRHIDMIAVNRKNATEEQHKLCTYLAHQLDVLYERSKSIVVIGTTNRLDVIDPEIMARFDGEIYMGMPDAKARSEIFNVLTASIELAENVDVQSIADSTSGYVGADILELIQRAVLLASVEGETIEQDHFQIALKEVIPTLKRDFTCAPNNTWDDVRTSIKHELAEQFLIPVKRAKDLESNDFIMPAGTLLFGPPKCGKTLIANALAKEAGINFVFMKGPDLLHKHVGESVTAVRVWFERARYLAPCILFVDQLDALCPKGGGSGRIINQMLAEMDILHRNKWKVFLLAATDSIDKLDDSLLGLSRLSQILYVDILFVEDHIEIIRFLTKDRLRLHESVDLKDIGGTCNSLGYKGQDLVDLVREAMRLALEDYPKTRLTTMVHFEAALEKVKPRLSEEEREEYLELRDFYTRGESSMDSEN